METKLAEIKESMEEVTEVLKMLTVGKLPYVQPPTVHFNCGFFGFLYCNFHHFILLSEGPCLGPLTLVIRPKWHFFLRLV